MVLQEFIVGLYNWRFDHPQNFPKLQQFNISPEDFELLDSTRLQIQETAARVQRQQEIIATIEKIGGETLSKLFAEALEEIFEKNDSDRKLYTENKHIIACLFRAANFIRTADATLLISFEALVKNKYAKLVASLTGKYNQEVIDAFEEQLVAGTIYNIKHPYETRFDIEEVIMDAKRYSGMVQSP